MINDSILFNACFASEFIPTTQEEVSGPFPSHFGLTPVGYKDESWPEGDGKPLTFVCQLNLSSAPEVMSTLQHIKLITFFLSPDHSKVGPENGQGWCLRTYETLEGLGPLAVPPDCVSCCEPVYGTWASTIDYPWPNDPDIVRLDDDELDFPRHVPQTKIWGFPTAIKSVSWWQDENHQDPSLRQIAEVAEPCFDLQISTIDTPVVSLGHRVDVLLLARGTTEGYKEQWYLDWQFLSEEN